MNIFMTEIEDLLTRYNLDSQNSRLRDYYEADYLWRTLRIERAEVPEDAVFCGVCGKTM